MWNEPVTLRNVLTMLMGWATGKAAFSYYEYRQWKKNND